MRRKEQQHVDSLKRKYLDLKDSHPRKVNDLYIKGQEEIDRGLNPTESRCESDVRDLDNQLSEAEKRWLSARTECLRNRARDLHIPLPSVTDSEAWQKKGDSLELTDQGESKVENALHKEERERSAARWSKVAIFVSIIAVILSAVALWYTWHKDTQPSAQTDNKTAPSGQPSSRAAKHK